MGLNPLCVALDVPTRDDALRLADALADEVGYIKVGLELFCSAGPSIVTELAQYKPALFLDLKFMDIPNTVASAVRQVAGLGASIINVHALGGREMMSAAQRGVADVSASTKLLAVTILTSLGQQELNQQLGIAGDVRSSVLRLAKLAATAGLAGVVASPQEIRALREELGGAFTILTPGIRPAWAADVQDQKRITTPAQAVKDGADIIVVGRPITRNNNPREAAKKIVEEAIA